jgi:hypothetical protein
MSIEFEILWHFFGPFWLLNSQSRTLMVFNGVGFTGESRQDGSGISWL